MIDGHEFSATVVAGDSALQFRMIDFSDNDTGFIERRTLLRRFVNDIHFHVLVVRNEPTK